MNKFKIFFVLFLTIIIETNAQGPCQGFNYMPPQPKIGDKVKFNYASMLTSLAGSNNIKCTAYFITKSEPIAVEIALKQNGMEYNGEFLLKDSTTLTCLVFKSGDEIIDNNKNNGYFIQTNYRNGTIVKNSWLDLAKVYQQFAKAMNLESDPIKFRKFAQMEYEIYPDQKLADPIVYINSFNLRNDSAKQKLLEIGNNVLSKSDQTYEDLLLARNIFQRLNNTNKSDSIGKILKNKFSDRVDKSSDIYSEFIQTGKLETKANIYSKNKEYLSKSIQIKERMISYLINEYEQKNDWKNFDLYINELDNKSKKFSIYNSLAWKFYESGKNTEKAILLSKEATEFAKNEIENPTSKQPMYLIESDRKKERGNNYATYADTYSHLLMKKKNYTNALQYQEEAVQLSYGKNPNINQTYIELLQLNNLPDRIFSESEKFIKSGNSNQTIKDIFSKNYISKKGSNKGLNDYINKLEASIKSKNLLALRRKMINENAPDFILENLTGDSISLKSLYGKVVVLDFWATWCGPCKASFPAMQKAVNKYSTDTNIVFLFIDTWEKADDKLRNAYNFITKMNYKFNVLLDSQNSVVENYKISGIPTKFVIDSHGKLQFKTVGYEDNEEVFLSELNEMILLSTVSIKN